MAQICDVAEWFLQKENMSHKKLQKLCYYAQAWSYALREIPIATDTKFEAWVHGPVSYDLFKEYSGNGWEPIAPEGRTLNFDATETDLLESVYLTYGGLSANELEALSHDEPPWRNAREGCAPGERCSNTIRINDMKKYYRSIYTGDDE